MLRGRSGNDTTEVPLPLPSSTDVPLPLPSSNAIIPLPVKSNNTTTDVLLENPSSPRNDTTDTDVPLPFSSSDFGREGFQRPSTNKEERSEE